jgi:hypothetical protein
MTGDDVTTNRLTRLDASVTNEAALYVSEGPVFMLNLLKFKEQADYGDGATFQPCSGRTAYFERYAPAFRLIGAPLGVRLFWAGKVLSQLVSEPTEDWDEVLLVEYPNFNAFKAATQDPRYASTAQPHRLAALDDWRLIVTRPER